MMTQSSQKLAKALLLPINPAAVVLLGIYTVVWGLWVANPFWSVFARAPLYNAMASLAPEYVWGIIAIICGLITIYGAVKRHYHPLVRGAFSSGIHWFVIAIFYFVGDWMSTGGITALIFAIYAGFIYLNIRVNFKDDRQSPYLLDPPRFRNRGVRH